MKWGTPVQQFPKLKAEECHTSAATVAVLPEAEDVDKKKDKMIFGLIRCEVLEQGQHVNTTDSAVELPTYLRGLL